MFTQRKAEIMSSNAHPVFLLYKKYISFEVHEKPYFLLHIIFIFLDKMFFLRTEYKQGVHTLDAAKITEG